MQRAPRSAATRRRGYSRQLTWQMEGGWGGGGGIKHRALCCPVLSSQLTPTAPLASLQPDRSRAPETHDYPPRGNHFTQVSRSSRSRSGTVRKSLAVYISLCFFYKYLFLLPAVLCFVIAWQRGRWSRTHVQRRRAGEQSLASLCFDMMFTQPWAGPILLEPSQWINPWMLSGRVCPSGQHYTASGARGGGFKRLYEKTSKPGGRFGTVKEKGLGFNLAWLIIHGLWCLMPALICFLLLLYF